MSCNSLVFPSRHVCQHLCRAFFRRLSEVLCVVNCEARGPQVTSIGNQFIIKWFCRNSNLHFEGDDWSTLQLRCSCAVAECFQEGQQVALRGGTAKRFELQFVMCHVMNMVCLCFGCHAFFTRVLTVNFTPSLLSQCRSHSKSSSQLHSCVCTC